MNKYIFILFLVLPFPLGAVGPSVQIQTEVSPKEIYIGDPVQYRVTIVCSSTVLPQPLNVEKLMGEFEILDIKSIPPEVTKDQKLALRHTLLVTSFSTGTWSFPGLLLKFSTPEGETSEAKTEDVSIKIKSLLEEKGDEGHLRPLKGLFNFRSYKWVWICAALLLLFLLIYALVRLMRKDKNTKHQPLSPPRPAEDVALEALQELEQTSLLQEGQYKEFYFRLSMISRHYLENRYGISAVERTTSELLLEFRKINLPLLITNILRDLFDNADLVKFAKLQPKHDEVIRDLARTREFIQLTTPPKQISTKEEVLPI